MSRLWTGILWLPTPTIDGRSVAPNAFEWDEPLPLLAIAGADEREVEIGEVTYIWEALGFGLAVGEVDDAIEVGKYPAGINPYEVEMEITGPESVTFIRGRLGSVSILPPTKTSAWPGGAEIQVHESAPVR